MRRKIITLFLCFFGSIGLVAAIYTLADPPNVHKNGFTRKVLPKVVLPYYIRETKSSNYYFCGADPQRIYFGNYDIPNYFESSNYNISDTHHVSLYAPEGVNPVMSRVAVFNPNIYLLYGHRASIFSYSKSNGSSLPVAQKVKTVIFNACTPISSTSFIIRKGDTSLHQYILAKVTTSSPEVKTQPNAIDKQVDGFLSADGMMCYDSTLSRLVYVYYYRNQFVCLDSNLSILYKGHTIDTVSRAKIQIHKFVSLNLITSSNPTIKINRACCVSNGLLFVNSSLIGDNEDRRLFNKCSVIDVYSLKDGQYRFSFYIRRVNAFEISEFKITGKTMIVIQGNFIVTYPLTI